jgi:hypothetical protein
MLQPSQVPAYLLFLAFVFFMIVIFEAVFRWVLRKQISEMQHSSDYSDREVNAVCYQTLALMIGVPLSMLFLVLSPLGWNLQHPFIYFLALALGFAPLAYIAVSSIRNRISIFRGRERLPVKGVKAVRSGVINLVLVILMFTGSVIFFASQFASLRRVP